MTAASTPAGKRPPERPRLVLAPIRGVTDAIYRNAHDEFFGGFDAAVTPFIPAVSARRYKPSQLRDVLPENNSGPALVPQILGNDPDDFVVLANILADIGYETVNWNLGCPFRRVAGKIRGSGLLPHPDRIEAFLDSAMPRIACGLSIKTRLGRFDSGEIKALMPVFNRYPLAELIIHPRTGVQMYEGDPDLDAFGESLAASTCPVIYNGDIRDCRSFEDLRQRFARTSGWMIGRGALVNPWLPLQILGVRNELPAAIEQIHRFHDRLLEGYCDLFSGPAHPVDRMKGLWGYLSHSFANGRNFLKRIQKTKTIDRYRIEVDRFFHSGLQWLS